MQNRLHSMGICLLSAFSIFATTVQAAPEAKHVAVTQIVEHPSLDQAKKGILDVDMNVNTSGKRYDAKNPVENLSFKRLRQCSEASQKSTS